MSKVNDLTGKKFGKLTVVKRNGSNKNGRALWLCECDCGNTKIVSGNSLLTKLTTSCGCYNKELVKKVNSKHNMSYTKLYKVWQGMKTRCYDKNFMYYYNYGGRGITICDEWKNDFSKFYEWAINNGYEEGLTIDRINVNGNYEPNNCRWITKKEQNDNMNKTIFLEYNGKKQTISQWSKELNITRIALYERIKRGWSAEKALTTLLKTIDK